MKWQRHSDIPLSHFRFPRADWLDAKHVVFGHVISGADVVRKMEKCGTKGGSTTAKVSIYACGELK